MLTGKLLMGCPCLTGEKEIRAFLEIDPAGRVCRDRRIAPDALWIRTWTLWFKRARFVLAGAFLSGLFWCYPLHLMTGFTQNELKVRQGLPSGDDKENGSAGGIEHLRSE